MKRRYKDLCLMSYAKEKKYGKLNKRNHYDIKYNPRGGRT